MIGLCTDSSAQVPPQLITRLCIEVVPLTVTIDEVDRLDGVDLDVDALYAHVARHGRSAFSISDPSPGQFAAAYDDLIARGCTEILSLHAGGALNAARLAAHATAVPVRVVDPGMCGFGVTCAMWAAGEAIGRGATLEQAVAVAEGLAPTVDHVVAVGTDVDPARPIALVRYRHGEAEVVQQCESTLDAVNQMAARVVGRGGRLRAAVGHSDAGTAPVADALEAAIGEPANVIDVVRYRIGPGGGGQAVPGTVSCYTFPGE